MRDKTRRVAVCGMMAALGTAAMLLGGVIPLATFCCPALAGLTLIPVFAEYGKKWALATWAAIAALSLILSPDKESALLFAFLGYWPVLKADLYRVRSVALRTACKLLVFNAAAAMTMLCVTYVFGMQYVAAEYAELTRIGLIAFAVLANLTILLYDRLLDVMLLLYRRRLRRILFRHG